MLNSVSVGEISGIEEDETINSSRKPVCALFLPDLGEMNLTFLASNGVKIITLLILTPSDAN